MYNDRTHHTNPPQDYHLPTDDHRYLFTPIDSLDPLLNELIRSVNPIPFSPLSVPSSYTIWIDPVSPATSIALHSTFIESIRPALSIGLRRYLRILSQGDITHNNRLRIYRGHQDSFLHLILIPEHYLFLHTLRVFIARSLIRQDILQLLH